MRTRTLAAAATAVALGALLSACGGGQQTLSHDELVSQAGEICSGRIASAQMVTSKPGNSQEELLTWGKSAGEAAPTLQEMAAGLAGLEPNSDDRSTYSDMVASWQDVANELQDAGTAAANQDTSSIAMNAANSATSIAAANAAAVKLGITACTTAT